MPRYKVTVSYDGTSFLGWQKQSEGRTVQTEIETVLSRLLDTPIVIFGSGRTDAGVHALGQVFHFDCEKTLDVAKFKHSLNCVLSEDIHVVEVKEVSADFHARYSVIAKHYRYVLNMGEADPLKRFYRYEMHQKLDVSAMEKASVLFLGKHAFQNFTSKEEDEGQFIRELTRLSITREGDVLTFDLVGDGFMRYMARMIVGTLIAVGQGKETLESVRALLQSEKRTVVSHKAPSQGLALVEVFYGEEKQ